jgi:Kef-type K+ transport system membrane component KefB
MMNLVTQVLAILFTGAVLGWVFKRVVYSSFIGYIVGGFLTSLLFTYLGVETSESVEFEFLKNLGLVIFSFEAGLSISVKDILRSLNRVLVIELTSYPLLWVSAVIIAGIINLGIVEETLLFLTIMNCSSLAIALARNISDNELKALAIIQSNFEDIAQFILFSTIFTAGISRPMVEDIAVDILKVIGLLTLLAYVLLKVVRKLRDFISRLDSSSKYLLILSIALLYSTITQSFGLPAFLGSFTAGLVLSEFISGEDLTLLSGIRELGLLLYFSSLGSQLILPQYSAGTPQQLLIGVVVGVLTVLIRITSLSIGSVLGALDPGHILTYVATLSSASETAIVFSDALVSRGVIPVGFRTLVILVVVTSILTSSIIYKEIVSIKRLVILILPQGLNQLISSLSSLLLHSSNLIVEVGKDLTKFLIILLAVTYALNIVAVICRYIPMLKVVLITLSMGVCYVVILTSFTRTIRNMYSRLIKEITSIKSSNWRDATVKLTSSLILVLSIILLVITSHRMLTEANLPTELHALLIISINTITMLLLIYIAFRELKWTTKTTS